MVKKVLLCFCIAAGVVAASPKLQDVLKEKSQDVYWAIMENIKDDTQTKTSQDLTQVFAENTYYYRSVLPVADQNTYDTILDGINNHSTEIKVSEMDTQKVSALTKQVIYDHPELFWIDLSQEYEVHTKGYIGNIGKTTVSMTYKYSEKEVEDMQKEIDTVADQILAKMRDKPDTYGKIKTGYDAMIELTDYDLEAPDNQIIYSVFANRRSVCAGYARSFQYLMQKAGIPCISVLGEADGAPHAWDLVQCDGTYYGIDPTWGDPVFLNENGEEVADVHAIYYDYFLCGSQKLGQTHVADSDMELPECSEEDYQ